MWPEHPYISSTNLIGIDPESWSFPKHCRVDHVEHEPVELLFRKDDGTFRKPLPLFGWTFPDGMVLRLRICRHCGELYPELTSDDDVSAYSKSDGQAY